MASLPRTKMLDGTDVHNPGRYEKERLGRGGPGNLIPARERKNCVVSFPLKYSAEIYHYKDVLGARSNSQLLQYGLRALRMLHKEFKDTVAETLDVLQLLEQYSNNPEIKSVVAQQRNKLATDYLYLLPPWLHDQLRRKILPQEATKAAHEHLKQVLARKVALDNNETP